MRNILIQYYFFIKKKCNFAPIIERNLTLQKMKKFLFTIMASVLMVCGLSAQNVARECVLFEVFTGVNCPFCPAAANGIAEMMEEGLSIVPVAYHTSYYSLEFCTTETNARATYYNVATYPTVKIDGLITKEGGGTASQSMYDHYQPYYEQRIATDSPFEIDLSFEYHSGTQCQAKAVVSQVGECSSDDVRVFIVLTESHIQRPWQGLPEVNFVVRDMLPNNNGTVFNGGTQEVTALFDIGKYEKENCQLVAWVQSYNESKEVYQAVKLDIAGSGAQYDMGITQVEEVPSALCSGRISPRMTIKNFGTESLQNITFNITDENGNNLGNYQWEGNLAKGKSDEFVIPEIDFGSSSTLKIEAVSLNGNDDEYAFDNVFSMTSESPVELAGGYMKFQIRTGSEPEAQSVEIKNMETGEVLYNFTFDEANKIYTEEVTLSEHSCYRVTFRNSNGNGADSGFYGIKDVENETIIMCNNSSNPFRYEFPIEFTFGGESVENTTETAAANIYPNPAHSVINVAFDKLSRVDVYNSMGALVYSAQPNENLVRINTESWVSGMYFISLENVDGDKVLQKIIVNK